MLFLYQLKKCEDGLLFPTRDRVLPRSVSHLDELALITGEKGIVAPENVSAENISHYVVVEKGPKCSTDVEIGKQCLHISVAGDKVASKYCIIREMHIIGWIE